MRITSSNTLFWQNNYTPAIKNSHLNLQPAPGNPSAIIADFLLSDENDPSSLLEKVSGVACV